MNIKQKFAGIQHHWMCVFFQSLKKSDIMNFFWHTGQWLASDYVCTSCRLKLFKLLQQRESNTKNKLKYLRMTLTSDPQKYRCFPCLISYLYTKSETAEWEIGQVIAAQVVDGRTDVIYIGILDLQCGAQIITWSVNFHNRVPNQWQVFTC